MSDKFLSISEARKYLNVSRATIDRWQAKGAIHPTYTPGGHRRFREADLRAAIGLEEQAPISQNRAVIYARVSTHKQADSGKLTRQEERLVTYAVKQGYQVVASLTEIASGINERRPQLGKGLQLIAEKKADILVVEFKDRLARFGYDYLELFITTLGGRIEVMETTETKSPNEELVEDLIAIITSCSARIYGKRGKRISDQVGELLRGELHNDDSGDDLARNVTGSLA